MKKRATLTTYELGALVRAASDGASGKMLRLAGHSIGFGYIRTFGKGNTSLKHGDNLNRSMEASTWLRRSRLQCKRSLAKFDHKAKPNEA